MEGNVLPKTSQPSPDQYLVYFEQARKNGDDIICVTISSALSGTYQCASIAKEMADYDNIYIIDSLTATVPQLSPSHISDLTDGQVQTHFALYLTLPASSERHSTGGR